MLLDLLIIHVLWLKVHVFNLLNGHVLNWLLLLVLKLWASRGISHTVVVADFAAIVVAGVFTSVVSIGLRFDIDRAHLACECASARLVN